MSAQVQEREKKKAKWYEAMVRDLQKLIKDLAYHSDEILRIKHEIGERIMREKDNVDWGRKAEFLREVAAELGYSVQELYNCVKFVEKWGDLEAFKGEVSNAVRNSEPSWHEVVNSMLYERKDDEVDGRECDVCHQKVQSGVNLWLCADCHVKVSAGWLL